MKSALIYTDDRTQVVLSPETDAEKSIVELFKSFMNKKPTICFGDFYGCQGGWHRFSDHYGNSADSVIIVFDKGEDAP